MRCPVCGYENPEGRRYCEECGEKLADLEARKARARRHTQREAARTRREADEKGLEVEEAERRKRRTRRRIRPWVGILLIAALAALIVVVIILLTSGGKSGPEQAVLDFYKSIQDKDVLSYLEHTDLELYKMAERGEIDLDPYTQGIDYDSYRLEDLETRLLKEEGDYAEVEVTGGYFEGLYSDGSGSGGVDFSQHPRKITLVKVEGKWLVNDYNMMKLPYPLPEIGPDDSEFPEADEPG